MYFIQEIHTCVYMHLCRRHVFNLTHHFVHLNLSIALLLGLITFVSGIEATSEYRVSHNVIYIYTCKQFVFCPQASCLTVAILLHYFFMAAFCWMLCEGVLLFVMLNFVFYEGFLITKRFFFAVGWGKKSFCINYCCLWWEILASFVSNGCMFKIM